MNAASTPTAANQADTRKPEFIIQRIYVKDVSYEAPNTPEIFKNDWEPSIELNLDITSKKLADEIHEVVLIITATAKIKDKVAFLIEAHQAGIFTMKGFTNEELKQMCGSFCPNILFPYARELISEMVTRGGFPSLYLAPVNFDAMYQQSLTTENNKADK